MKVERDGRLALFTLRPSRPWHHVIDARLSEDYLMLTLYSFYDSLNLHDVICCLSYKLSRSRLEATPFSIQTSVAVKSHNDVRS